MEPATDPAVEFRNGLAFSGVTILSYLASPVLYVGVVQAALCARLGANATIANLPSTVFILGGVAPLLVSSNIPIRYERAAAAAAMIGSSILLGAMALVLPLPLSKSVKIAMVILTSCLTGVLSLIQQTYVMQCLKRGTSLVGRARTLKYAYSIGPLAAVVGSLLAQFLLNAYAGNDQSLGSFAILYAVAVPCLLISAIFVSRMQLADAFDEPKPPLFRYLGEAMRAVAGYRPLLLICCIATIHNLGMSVLPNLALYGSQRTGHAVGELVGFMMAVRFGAKSIAGGLFGFLAEKRGTPAALIALEVFLLAAMIVGSFATGYSYLAAFALVGGAELAGVYHPNYCLSISRTETGARNLSVLIIISTLASIGGTINGLLSDLVDFRASFAFAALCAVVCLALIRRLPSEQAVTEPSTL